MNAGVQKYIALQEAQSAADAKAAAAQLDRATVSDAALLRMNNSLQGYVAAQEAKRAAEAASIETEA